jgi:hypothetical protein
MLSAEAMAARNERKGITTRQIYGMLSVSVGCLVILGAAWMYLPADAPDKAHYDVTIGDDPVQTLPRNQSATAYQNLSDEGQELFINIYTEGNDFGLNTVKVNWSERNRSIGERFKNISYIEYQGLYYPITTTVTRVGDGSDTARYIIKNAAWVPIIGILLNIATLAIRKGTD